MGIGKKRLILGDRNSAFFAWRWQTVDLFDADYIIDLRRAVLPFKDGSVKLIYTSHTIEHIQQAALDKLLSEIYRILYPGGILRIVTPDMDKAINAYKHKDWNFFELYRKSLSVRVDKGLLSPESLEMHNLFVQYFASYSGRVDTAGGPILEKETVDRYLRRMDKYEFARWCVSQLEPGRVCAHVNAFDYSKLENMLTKAGFEKVTRSDFRQSQVAKLRRPEFDLDYRKSFSLYVEATRVGGS